MTYNIKVIRKINKTYWLYSYNRVYNVEGKFKNKGGNYD